MRSSALLSALAFCLAASPVLAETTPPAPMPAPMMPGQEKKGFFARMFGGDENKGPPGMPAGGPPSSNIFATVKDGSATWNIMKLGGGPAQQSNQCNAMRVLQAPAPTTSAQPSPQPGLPSGQHINVNIMRVKGMMGANAVDRLQYSVSAFTQAKDASAPLSIGGSAVGKVVNTSVGRNASGEIDNAAAFKAKLAGGSPAVFQLGDEKVTVSGDKMLEIVKQLDACIAEKK